MKEMPMWYSAGTVAVTANSATVTGTGTAFSANARVGDAFRGPDGRWYAVTNIASASVLSISPAYQGDTATGQAYAIAPIQGYVKESADRLRQLTEQIGSNPLLQTTEPAEARQALGATEVGDALFTAANAQAALQALGATEVGDALFTAANAQAALQALGTTEVGRALLAAVDAMAARQSIGADNAESLTAGLLNVARIPATLTPDKAYRRGNILGTVSQSGGVPTGAIIERGSNANGSYVRFADGTQECWTYKTAIVPAGGVVGFSFTNAATFLGEVPASFPSVSPESFTLEIAWGMEAHSATGATVYVQNKGTAGRNVAVFFRTIGRWY